MKNPYLLTLVFLFITSSIFSQSIERQLIGVAGENDSGKQILLTWTLGEPFTFYDVTLLGDYKEGYLQPHDLLQELDKFEPDVNYEFLNHFDAKVFPNPFNEAFAFQVNHELGEDAQLTFLDYSGKNLMTKVFPAGSLKMHWAMNTYPPGLYILQFTDGSGILRQSFKLLKL